MSSTSDTTDAPANPALFRTAFIGVLLGASPVLLFVVPFAFSTDSTSVLVDVSLECLACASAACILAQGPMGWLASRGLVVVATALAAIGGLVAADDLEAARRGAVAVWLLSALMGVAWVPRLARALRTTPVRDSSLRASWRVVRACIAGLPADLAWVTLAIVPVMVACAFPSPVPTLLTFAVFTIPVWVHLRRTRTAARLDDALDLVALLAIGAPMFVMPWIVYY